MRVREDRPHGGGPFQKGSSAMLWRHLGLVRAGLAAGLASGMILIGAWTARAQTPAAGDTEPSSAPAGRGDRDGRSPRRPERGRSRRGRARPRPGSGAPLDPQSLEPPIERRDSARLGRLERHRPARRRRRGGGGGLQSMGLGSVSNREGAFGEFRGTTSSGGLQSVAARNEAIASQVAVPVGETVELNIPAVCLNYGLPSPTPRNTFRLVDVNEYSSNPRVRRALRSLATYGTSHGVAQAVMWRVCNDLPFEMMAEQTGKVMNAHEIALAARFVEALDAPAGSRRSGRPGGSLAIARLRSGPRQGLTGR